MKKKKYTLFTGKDDEVYYYLNGKYICKAKLKDVDMREE
jgi:hypothetical protein